MSNECCSMHEPDDIAIFVVSRTPVHKGDKFGFAISFEQPVLEYNRVCLMIIVTDDYS